jgi:hypothetical protein
MKVMILTTVLTLMLSTVSFAGKIVAEGKTYSALGDYRIELADIQVPLNGTDCKAYKISYENTSMDVTLVVCNDKAGKCKKYVVLSDQLSVQYVCNDLYFGVEKLDKSLQAEGFSTSDSGLNRAEYFHQKVIGVGHQDEREATRLVAAYFPFLLNDSQQITANR